MDIFHTVGIFTIQSLIEPNLSYPWPKQIQARVTIDCSIQCYETSGLQNAELRNVVHRRSSRPITLRVKNGQARFPEDIDILKYKILEDKQRANHGSGLINIVYLILKIK